MDHAAIAQAGTPRELYEAPASLFVAGFVGDANVVAAELVEREGTRGRLRLGDIRLDLPHRGALPGPVRLAIRPEALGLATAPPDRPALAGRVVKVAYLGNHMEYTVATAVGELFVVDPAVTRPAAVGDPVWLAFADHGVTVIPPGQTTPGA
jgi:iron(III) transport system ATP-binding protein